MKVLAIDLGHTIGYAFCADNVAIYPPAEGTNLIFHGTVPLGHIFELRNLASEPDLIIVERPAYKEKPEIQERYEAEIHSLRVLFGANKVGICRPADWMPRFMHYPLPGRGMLQTQHEKDAFRMAQWALEKFA